SPAGRDTLPAFIRPRGKGKSGERPARSRHCDRLARYRTRRFRKRDAPQPLRGLRRLGKARVECRKPGDLTPRQPDQSLEERVAHMPHTFAARIRSSLLFTAAAAACLLVVAPGEASAKSALAEVRVEGPAGTIDPGAWYVTGNERVRRGRGHRCKNRKGSQRFTGPSALTLLASAGRNNKKLRPARVRDTDFGPQLCQIGSLRSYGAFPNPNGGFLFWINDA